MVVSLFLNMVLDRFIQLLPLYLKLQMTGI